MYHDMITTRIEWGVNTGPKVYVLLPLLYAAVPATGILTITFTVAILLKSSLTPHQAIP